MSSRGIDVLVFAPHPDDDVIGAGGILQQAAQRGERVQVVFVTNGDGYMQAACALSGKAPSALQAADYVGLAATRQREAVAAALLLGVDSSSLLFLGYPDAALGSVCAARGERPVRSPMTGRTQTYGPVAPDHHTRAHGRPAPYTHDAALGDVREILSEAQAARVYVTDRTDEHPDHAATYELVHDALGAHGDRRRLLTYLVHGGDAWPRPPGATPELPFEPATAGGTTAPTGLCWPPSIRVPLSAAESARKLQALQAHRSQWAIDRAYLESFVKSEEIFWLES